MHQELSLYIEVPEQSQTLILQQYNRFWRPKLARHEHRNSKRVLIIPGYLQKIIIDCCRSDFPSEVYCEKEKYLERVCVSLLYSSSCLRTISRHIITILSSQFLMPLPCPPYCRSLYTSIHIIFRIHIYEPDTQSGLCPKNFAEEVMLKCTIPCTNC